MKSQENTALLNFHRYRHRKARRAGAKTPPPHKKAGQERKKMRKNDAIMELVAGYDAYVGAEDLSVSAAGDAPASTPYCVISVSVSFVTAITLSIVTK
ncbi:LxmA leader domain family RiPP [Streptosporangium sp. NPDC000396]|uniref:LxmA leader domain family RiPP n=1 Tax=Streptosporangium sp. NPDC000396 TaxID=3366185 RepID=UPI003695FCC7